MVGVYEARAFVRWKRFILPVALMAAIIAGGVKAWSFYYYRYRPIALKDFAYPFDPDHGTIKDIPKWVRDLDGKNVVIEGWMIPLDQAENISQFALFNGIFDLNHPLIPQRIFVCNMTHGNWAPFNPDSIRVFGKMHVQVVRDSGFIVSLYSIDVTRVEDSTKPVVPFPKWRFSAGIVAIVSAILVFLRVVIVQFRKRHRLRAGLCVACGYDLRASPECCPECGMARPKASNDANYPLLAP